LKVNEAITSWKLDYQDYTIIYMYTNPDAEVFRGANVNNYYLVILLI